MNLRGIARPVSMIYDQLNRELVQEAREAVPDQRYPFWIHKLCAWDCTWAFHSGTGGVFLDGLDAYDVDYGIWRSVIDRHIWRNTSMKNVRNKDLHMPFRVGVPHPDREDPANLAYLAAIQGFVDDAPPLTVITHVLPQGDHWIVRGTSADSSEIRQVTVNEAHATSVESNFLSWEAKIPAAGAKPVTLTASAEDVHQNREEHPHVEQTQRD